MYDGKYVLVDEKTAREVFGDAPVDVVCRAVQEQGEEEAPKTFAVVFEESYDGIGESEGWSPMWLAPALTPAVWLIMQEDGNVASWLSKNALALQVSSRAYSLAKVWLRDSVNLYNLVTRVTGLPVPNSALYLDLYATSPEKAQEVALAILSGMPVFFSNDDLQVLG